MNTIREIRQRQMPGDFVLAFWGMGNKAICDALPDMINVEPGIGYGVAFAEFRIYESYALMHAYMGTDKVLTSGNMPWYHVVIPNYFDTKDFEFSDIKKDYFLCIGRITRGKGVDIALDITDQIGAKLVIAGQGEPRDLGLDAWPDHVEYVGYADGIKRRKLLTHAKGVFVLSTYLEPFCGVMIESFLSGTPVISTDWGTFTENNLHGLTGYRCRTFDHMVWAARNIHKIDAHTCRRWGENFTCNKVAPMYEEYFESINKCWYAVNNNRTNLDSIKRIFPSVNPCNIDAIFPCFKQVYAADMALESYRSFYPNGKIIMMCDGGDPGMKIVAKKYRADYSYHRHIGIRDWKNQYEWVERFFGAVGRITTDFFVMQEEDVFHVRSVDASKLVFDICGTNPGAIFPQELIDYTGHRHYAGSGGCFFRTEFFKKITSSNWRKHIRRPWLHADIVLSVLTYMNGGTIGYCTECVEFNRPEYKTNPDHAVIHQYKKYYIDI